METYLFIYLLFYLHDFEITLRTFLLVVSTNIFYSIFLF